MPENKSAAELNLKDPVTRLVNYFFKRNPDGLDETADVIKNERLAEIDEALATSAIFSFLAPLTMLAAVGAYNEYSEFFEEFEELEKEKENTKEHLMHKMCSISDRCRQKVASKCGVSYYSMYSAPDVSNAKDLSQAAAMVSEYNSLQNKLALNAIEKKFGWTEFASLCSNSVAMCVSLTSASMTIHEEYFGAKEGVEEGAKEGAEEGAKEGLMETAHFLEEIATDFFIGGQALMVAESARNIYVAREKLKDLDNRKNALNRMFDTMPKFGVSPDIYRKRYGSRPFIDAKTTKYLGDLRREQKKFIKWGRLYPAVATGAGSGVSLAGLVLAPSGASAGMIGASAAVIGVSRFIQNRYRSKERRFHGVKADKFPITKNALKDLDTVKIVGESVMGIEKKRFGKRQQNPEKTVLAQAYENSAKKLSNSLQNANNALVLSKLSSLILHVAKKGGDVNDLESLIEKLKNTGAFSTSSKTHSGIISEVKDELLHIVRNKENKQLFQDLFKGEKDKVAYRLAKFSCEVAKYLENGVANDDLISLDDLFAKTSRAVISDEGRNLLPEDKVLLSIGVRPEKNPVRNHDGVKAVEFASTVIEHTKTSCKNVRMRIARGIEDLAVCMSVNKELKAQENVTHVNLSDVEKDLGLKYEKGKWVEFVEEKRSKAKAGAGVEVSI